MTDLSLGDIVSRMQIATPEQVEEALADQRRMSDDDVLGELLVARGVISREQLAAALRLQRGLNSKDKHVRAMTMAKLSRASGAQIVDLAGRLRATSRAARRASAEMRPVTGALAAQKT
jgi:cytochrome oxidase assembly protein ShyY1